MDKRYQVFISSTFTDLEDERKTIIEHLLNSKYIPAGMELFSASNDEQFEYIKKIIDTCDYYVLIIAARYGSINPSTGLSFTEQEYDYAVSKNIPVLVFPHSDPYNLPANKREDDKKQQLEAFRDKALRGRMGRPWKNIDQLALGVITSLIQETTNNPQLGWVRGGSGHDNTELLSQINQLRIEKEAQEKEIKRLTLLVKNNSPKIDNLACGSDTYTIKGMKYHLKTTQSGEITLTWDQIFSAIAPYLIAHVAYATFEVDLKNSINSAFNQRFSYLNGDCIQTIKIHLNALELIDVRASKSTTRGIMEFIGLSDKGRNYLLQLKSIKK